MPCDIASDMALGDLCSASVQPALLARSFEPTPGWPTCSRPYADSFVAAVSRHYYKAAVALLQAAVALLQGWLALLWLVCFKHCQCVPGRRL
jgi:hypothetical protein